MWIKRQKFAIGHRETMGLEVTAPSATAAVALASCAENVAACGTERKLNDCENKLDRGRVRRRERLDERAFIQTAKCWHWMRDVEINN